MIRHRSLEILNCVLSVVLVTDNDSELAEGVFDPKTKSSLEALVKVTFENTAYFVR